MSTFISFKPQGVGFTGHLSLEAIDIWENPELLIKKASKAYRESILKMRKILTRIDKSRRERKPLYARIMWDMGSAVFELRDKLAEISLEIDGMYSHLERDLGVRQKWLEKAIILRRYIKRSLIPQNITWSRFEHSTRKKAEGLAKGLPIE